MTTTPYQPSRSISARLSRLWARVGGKEAARMPIGRAMVSISFDDFPKSAAEAGSRILESRGLRGTYYVSAGLAGGRNHFGDLFDAGDVSALSAAGHEIGCHTYSHLDCSCAEIACVESDVERNRDAMAALGIERRLRSFAYPYGCSTASIKRWLAPRYDTLRGVLWGVNRGVADRAQLYSPLLDSNPDTLRRLVNEIGSLSTVGGWLIVFTHDVRRTPSAWGCTPDALERFVDAALEAGLEIAPVGDAAPKMLEARDDRHLSRHSHVPAS